MGIVCVSMCVRLSKCACVHACARVSMCVFLCARLYVCASVCLCECTGDDPSLSNNLLKHSVSMNPVIKRWCVAGIPPPPPPPPPPPRSLS